MLLVPVLGGRAMRPDAGVHYALPFKGGFSCTTRWGITILLKDRV